MQSCSGQRRLIKSILVRHQLYLYRSRERQKAGTHTHTHSSLIRRALCANYRGNTLVTAKNSLSMTLVTRREALFVSLKSAQVMSLRTICGSYAAMQANQTRWYKSEKESKKERTKEGQKNVNLDEIYVRRNIQSAVGGSRILIRSPQTDFNDKFAAAIWSEEPPTSRCRTWQASWALNVRIAATNGGCPNFACRSGLDRVKQNFDYDK